MISAEILSEDRGELLALLPSGAVCAEIGVWKGDFSQLILELCQPRELHLVDPWEFAPNFPKRWYGGAKAKSQNDMDDIWRSVMQRFGMLPSVTIHKRKSTEFAAECPDGYFDWIYVDGDHSYAAVLEDLECWYPKLKRGGYISGDDYYWRDENQDYSVRRAVEWFVASKISRLSAL